MSQIQGTNLWIPMCLAISQADCDHVKKILKYAKEKLLSHLFPWYCVQYLEVESEISDKTLNELHKAKGKRSYLAFGILTTNIVALLFELLWINLHNIVQYSHMRARLFEEKLAISQNLNENNWETPMTNYCEHLVYYQ